jgi:hypothetical protein
MFYLAIKEHGRLVAHVPISGTRATIGRDATNDVVILRATVSSSHAEIGAGASGFEIRDLGSRNGTWVNGARIGETTPIKPEDRIRIGHFQVELASVPLPYPGGFFNQLDRAEPQILPGAQTEADPLSREELAALRARRGLSPPPPRKGGE